ncbi:MAG TPA: hypothetical protein VI732_06055, partial [Alphaproteobacteria bacterium]|nr:hypothetical protein [Alphaproteobacteria bacterium]
AMEKALDEPEEIPQAAAKNLITHYRQRYAKYKELFDKTVICKDMTGNAELGAATLTYFLDRNVGPYEIRSSAFGSLLMLVIVRFLERMQQILR